LREIAALPDPVGRVLEGGVRPNGLRVVKVGVPLGVIFFLYESRPNVTVDAAAVAVKSGNALILRGGKEARHSNAALHRILAATLAAEGLPAEAVQSAIRFGASLTRVLADPDAEGSPLLRARSLSWRFLALDVGFADLRAAAKAADASLNDAFLAALLGAFRLYHAKFGSPIETMPIAIPISVRKPDDPEGGNKFTGARFAAPVGVADPAERMKKMGELVREARNEPALDGMSLVAPLLARLPAPLISQLGGSLTKSNDLQASNVPGFQEDLYMAGAKIERVYGLGPLPGCATMITLITHGPTACVGVNLDPAAVTDPELFAECVLGGFAEVLALRPGAAAPTRLV